MKLASAATIRAFLIKPGSHVHIVLLHGPDHGRIRDRARQIERAHLGAQPGPFSQTLLTDSDLKNDPARLQDAFCARSLDGGAQVLRLKTRADQSAKPVLALLKTLAGQDLFPAALLLIEADTLGPRSKLRQGIEKSGKYAVALPCYAPEASDLRTMAQALARDSGLHFADGALEVLLERLARDSAMAKQELEKLMCYAGSPADGAITCADIAAIVSTADQGLDAFVFAVAGQNAPAADRCMTSALEGGLDPIALLRGLQRHFLRVIEAKLAHAGGKSPEAAMAGLRPPVFYQQKQAFSRHMHALSMPACRCALAFCLATEQAMKTGGANPRSLLARLVLKLTAATAKT